MEHRYWRDKLATRLRDCGYTVEEESPIGGGKAIDLVAVKGGRKVAIETGKSDVAANVDKALAAAMDAIVVVATSAGARERLARKLRDNPKVRLVSAAEALRAVESV
jgi:Holliday junction resolvase